MGVATPQPDASERALEAGIAVRTAEAGIEAVAAPRATPFDREAWCDREAPCDWKVRSGLPESGRCARASGRPTGQDRPSPERSPGEEIRLYQRRPLPSGMLTRHRPAPRRDEPIARRSDRRRVHWPALH